MNPAYCHACGQALPQRGGRVCSLCELPIALHDRWKFVGARVQHKDCHDPKLEKLTAAGIAAKAQQQELAG